MFTLLAPRRIPRPPTPWIDLLDPDDAEIAAAEAACGHALPTRSALSEVESSSRHYRKDGAIYLSAVLATEEAEPQLTPVGFILWPDRLVTLRYAKSRAFDAAADALAATPAATTLEAFIAIVEEIVDNLADRLELCGGELESLSRTTFHAPVASNKAGRQLGGNTGKHLRTVLASVGREGDRLSKLRASLLTFARIAAYLVDAAPPRRTAVLSRRLAQVRDDLASLSAYQETLFNRTQFLLDAVLGFISIDQNDVIKVLTVVSVVGVPPTLIASIYGMNFKIIPELTWTFGYPYALAMIAVSALAPLAWFKWRGWF